MKTVLRCMLFVFLLMGCGSSPSDTETDGGPGLDAAPDASDASDASDATIECPDVGCRLACEHGFVRDSNGCETCMCKPAPDLSCTTEGDCALAVDSTVCCTCPLPYSREQVEEDPCLVEGGGVPPSGCHPSSCDAVACGACPDLVRATCEMNECRSSNECATGQVRRGSSCDPACASHADCTLAADYGSCCGGCSALHVSVVAEDMCFAERQSESDCAPAPGSCDGLGCPSPPFVCVGAGGEAVCMSDGLCRQAGLGGACPPGFMDAGGVCAPE